MHCSTTQHETTKHKKDPIVIVNANCQKQNTTMKGSDHNDNEWPGTFIETRRANHMRSECVRRNGDLPAAGCRWPVAVRAGGPRKGKQVPVSGVATT
jgi:hypothetical protein